MESHMPKPALITVTCPCCQAELHIDPQTHAVIRHQEHVKPPSMADIETAVQRYKGEEDRRNDAYQKSVQQEKSHADVLNKKFDEMLRLAKENPDAPPPKREFDYD